MCKADREVRPIFFNKTHYLHCTFIQLRNQTILRNKEISSHRHSKMMLIGIIHSRTDIRNFKIVKWKKSF